MARQLVVVGAGVGGLSVAVHARLNGWDVLVLEQRDLPGGKAAQLSVGGHTLDPGPSIVILTEVYDQVFRDAGRRREDYLQFEPLDPFTRVYLEGEDAPIDLPAGREACLARLAEVAPQDRDGVRDLLARLDRVAPGLERTVFSGPIDRPWQLADPRFLRVATQFDVRKTYKELVDGFVRSPLLRAFFYGFPSYSGQTYRSKAAGALLIPYFMLDRGVWWPVGGIGAIPRALHRLACELGVEFRFGAKVTGLRRARGRVTAVETEGGPVEADAVACNRDRVSVGAWLGRPLPIRSSSSYWTLHWGLRRRVPGLSHHTLLVPADFEEGFRELYDERRPPARPVVYLNDTSDRGMAPPGETNLFAVLTVPGMEPGLDWDAEGDRLRRATLSALCRAGLEFDEADILFERRQDPGTFAERDGNHLGSLYGPDEEERLWGLLPLRVRDEEVGNLFYVGGSVQPGAGLPMVTLSGRFAAMRMGPGRG